MKTTDVEVQGQKFEISSFTIKQSEFVTSGRPTAETAEPWLWKLVLWSLNNQHRKSDGSFPTPLTVTRDHVEDRLDFEGVLELNAKILEFNNFKVGTAEESPGEPAAAGSIGPTSAAA